jgi:predicted nucleic acid-binding protein
VDGAPPVRVILDTNIYITGYVFPGSDEYRVLEVIRRRRDIVVFSHEIEDQIRRVGRRVQGKDYAGLILNTVWRDFVVDYVALPDLPFVVAERLAPGIPKEDVLVFLSAVAGQAACLVSNNREFLRESEAAQRAFRSLTPGQFLATYE